MDTLDPSAGKGERRGSRRASMSNAAFGEAPFKGRRIVITGSRQGIGRELCKILHEQGAICYAVSRFEQHLKSLKKECPNVIIVPCNLRNWRDIEEALAEVVDEPIDVLVNNAEEIVREKFLEMKAESLDRVFDINVKAVVCVSKIIAKNMIKSGKGGVIINLSSLAAKVPTAGSGLFAYCASKAAQDMITRCMAIVLGPHGIRVNSVNPTIITNDFRKDFWVSDEESRIASETLMQLTPLGRFAELEDVLNTIIFLMSENSKMITGESITIDGGYVAR